ncbi:MAG: cytochrome c family protein [Planctomycetaceae bacterium]|nr:cytochrome c family protein [Planctomycetaceae bacterium]
MFPKSANILAGASLLVGLLLLASLTWSGLVYTRSSYGTGTAVAVVQPVPFSHQHHVGVLGIECRYCHTSVEHSSFAGIPPTKTCMNCHSQIWVGSQMLEPVRESYRMDRSLRWQRVYNLPGFVYFDHSVHVQTGIGCSSCHGRVDQMPFTYQVPTLLMEWCLDCHRDPASRLRPREEVFNMKYEVPANQRELGQQLIERYGVRSPSRITSCSACHR